ncbi:DUF262 domain-containing protein [Veronia nyctiphanis]|nr:DUF262 domain-containing protein [Veronia nyctiphanis]
MTNLLEDLSSGAIKIPSFQRPLVWDWDQRHDLLCSVMEGLPIGAILIWQTKNNQMRQEKRIGPIQLKFEETFPVNQFVMDGLQRLSTLYCALFYDKNNLINDSSSLEHEVFCDLDSDSVDDLFINATHPSLKNIIKFIRDPKLNYDGNLDDISRYIPLNTILNSRLFLSHQRRISIDKEHRIDKSDEIQSAFKNYKIPIVPLESDRQDIVTKAFERINNRGTTMSEAHMVNAFSNSMQFEFLALLENLKKKYLVDKVNRNWVSIDDGIILSLVKIELGIDIYSKSPEKLSKSINESLLSKIFENFTQAIHFCERSLFIDSPSKFPYKMQLICILFYFFKCRNRDLDKLRAWYYVTTYAKAFGANARNSSNAINDFRKFIDDGVLTWSLNFKPEFSIATKKISLKNSRSRVWSHALYLKQVEVFGDSDLVTIESNLLKIPDELNNRYQSTYKNRAGMNFLCLEKTRKFSICDLSPREMSAHFLTDELVSMFNAGRYEEFSLEREQYIFSWEKDNIISTSISKLNFSI